MRVLAASPPTFCLTRGVMDGKLRALHGQLSQGSLQPRLAWLPSLVVCPVTSDDPKE